jgi:hypothetical protein
MVDMIFTLLPYVLEGLAFATTIHHHIQTFICIGMRIGQCFMRMRDENMQTYVIIHQHTS